MSTKSPLFNSEPVIVIHLGTDDTPQGKTLAACTGEEFKPDNSNAYVGIPRVPCVACLKTSKTVERTTTYRRTQKELPYDVALEVKSDIQGTRYLISTHGFTFEVGMNELVEKGYFEVVRQSSLAHLNELTRKLWHISRYDKIDIHLAKEIQKTVNDLRFDNGLKEIW
jgi:hypothetical protein